MPAPLRPNSTPTFGRKNWVVAAAISSPTLAPTVLEATTTTSLDITDIIFGDGTDRPTQNTNRVESIRRWGETRQFEQIGITTYTGGNLTYALATQGAAASDGKKLFERIPAGTTGFLIERLGVAKDANFTAGQFVNVYPVTFGPSMPTEVGDGENAEAGAMSAFAVTGPPAFNVAILA